MPKGALKPEVILAKPSEITLENEGAEYSPGDTSALRNSYEITKGWVNPPLVYRHPSKKDNALYCLDGNHRLMVLRMRGWGDTAIPMLRVRPPREVRSERDLLEWRLRDRTQVNSKRRVMTIPEWKVLFEMAQMELGWTQKEIGVQYGWDPADVSRILLGKYETHVKEKGDQDKKARKAAKVGDLQAVVQTRFKAANKGDTGAVKDLQMAFWRIGRKLLALKASLPDPNDEDPWRKE